MKLLITLSVIWLIVTYSKPNYAIEHDIATTPKNDTFSDLIINNSPTNQMLYIDDLTAESFNVLQPLETTPSIEGKYNNKLLSIKAGVLQSKQESSASKYYFQGTLTLHQHKEFNVSIMANLEQLNNVNYLSNQALFVDNALIMNETEVNYSYGIITSYTINQSWQFSGGIIHAEPLYAPTLNTWNNDENMALIGTTYSF